MSLGAPPNRTSRTAKGCQALETQPLQTVLLMWEGQCKFSDAYAGLCFKVLEPILAKGEKTIKDPGVLAILVSSCLGIPGLLCWRCWHPLVLQTPSLIQAKSWMKEYLSCCVGSGKPKSAGKGPVVRLSLQELSWESGLGLARFLW